MDSMADGASFKPYKELEAELKRTKELLKRQSDGDVDLIVDRKVLMEAVAKLYGRGIPRPKIARMLVDYLVPNNRHRPPEQRYSQARSKLRKWEFTQEFRDLIYKHAVVELDLETPRILKGVAGKAKRGRVDAARLALEITGRHSPKGDIQPTQVAVVFQGVPRPPGRTTVDGEAVEVRELEE